MFILVEPTNMTNNASKCNVWWHQGSAPCHMPILKWSIFTMLN